MGRSGVVAGWADDADACDMESIMGVRLGVGRMGDGDGGVAMDLDDDWIPAHGDRLGQSAGSQLCLSSTLQSPKQDVSVCAVQGQRKREQFVGRRKIGLTPRRWFDGRRLTGIANEMMIQ